MPFPWITPPTYVDDDVIRAPTFTTYVAQNLNYLYRISRRLTGDQIVSTNPGTPIGAFNTGLDKLRIGDTWIFKLKVFYTNVAGANGVQVLVHGGGSAQPGAIAYVGADRATPTSLRMTVAQSITLATVYTGPSSTTGAVMMWRGIIRPSAALPEMGVHFGPFTNGNNATIKAGSYLILERVEAA
jgi:hypothetical protein